MLKQNKGRFIIRTEILGPLIIKMHTLSIEIGFLREITRFNYLEPFEVNFKTVQFNHLLSYTKVIRGIRTEKFNKLVYALTLKMFSYYADASADSETFFKIVSLKFDNTKKPCGMAVYILAGVGNSICFIGRKSLHYIYLVDEYFGQDKASGIAWDNPDLKIDWHAKNPILI